jgi:hypothetical protein
VTSRNRISLDGQWLFSPDKITTPEHTSSITAPSHWQADDLFRDHTSGVMNFAFGGLTPEHVITDFSPREFAFDVYAGLFVGWLHKPVPTIAGGGWDRGKSWHPRSGYRRTWRRIRWRCICLRS